MLKVVAAVTEDGYDTEREAISARGYAVTAARELIETSQTMDWDEPLDEVERKMVLMVVKGALATEPPDTTAAHVLRSAIVKLG